MWKKKELNKYPDVILSDCKVAMIQLEEQKIIVTFTEHGFFKIDSKSNRYYRTDGAQIVIEEGNIDTISIKEIRTQRLSEELYFETMHEVRAKDFLVNINTGKWRLEIVEEFYSTGGGLYIARVRANENSFWCHIKLEFKNLLYSWNDIKYDFPF